MLVLTTKELGYEGPSEGEFRERNHDAVIQEVDPEKGMARVRILNSGVDKWIQVGVQGGLTINPDNGSRSSWRRYMPGTNAVVTLGYTPAGETRAVAFHGYGEIQDEDGNPLTPASGERSDGYAALARTARRSDSVLAAFRPLRPGEWHDRSSGGAEVYGGADGQLQLASGRAVVRLGPPEADGRADVEVTARRVRMRETARPSSSGVTVTFGVQSETGGSLGPDFDGAVRRRSYRVDVTGPGGVGSGSFELGDVGQGTWLRLRYGPTGIEANRGGRVRITGARVELADLAGATRGSVTLFEALLDAVKAGALIAPPGGGPVVLAPTGEVLLARARGQVQAH